MAELDFPASPTEGQVYSPAGAPSYVWHSPVWDIVSVPANASAADAWWETRTAFVASVAGGMPISKGKLYTAGGAQYIGADPFVTDLPGLPKLKAYGVLTPEHFGIPQGSDQTALLDQFVNYAATNHLAVEWPDGGDYQFQELKIVGPNKEVTWRCAGTCKLTSLKTAVEGTDNNDAAIELNSGSPVGYALTADAPMGQSYVLVADSSMWQPGDLCELRSSRLIQTDDRGGAREGQVSRVVSVATGRLNLEDPLHYFAPASVTFTGAVVAVADTLTMTLAASINRQPRDMRSKLTMTSGAQSGQERYIDGWDNTTKVAKFDVNTPWGAGILPGDTYTFTWDTFAMRVTAPMKISISKGLHLTRAPHINAAADGDLGYNGFYIYYASRCDIDQCKVDYFSNGNIILYGCYRPRITNNEVSWANRQYAGAGGTGDSISVGQCYAAHIEGNWGTACRRLVDFSGSQAISWYCKSIRNTAYGGGTNYRGQPMFPEDPGAGTQVSGSHGGAYGTVYSGDTGVHVWGIHNIRGLNETITSAYGYGHMELPILYQHGGGLICENVHYRDTFSEIGKDAATRYAVTAKPELRPHALIEFWCDTPTINSLPTRIFNCTAHKLRYSVIRFNRGVAADEIANVEFGNIRATVSKEGYPADVFQFLRTTQRTTRGITDLGGNAYSFDGAEFTSFSLALYSTNSLDIPVGNYVRMPNDQYHAVIAAGTAIAIPLGVAIGQARVSIFDNARDRNYGGMEMIIAQDRAVDYSPLAASNKTNVEISLDPLTGTTGTAGKVTLALRPDTGAGAGLLYIENRTATDPIRPIISVKGML